MCHIWELGSGTTFASLLSVVAKVKPSHSVAVILVLDLTSPERILNTVETLLDTTKAAITKSLETPEDVTKPTNANIEVRLPYFYFFSTWVSHIENEICKCDQHSTVLRSGLILNYFYLNFFCCKQNCVLFYCRKKIDRI